MLDLRTIDSALSGTIFSGKLHHALVTDSTNSDAVAGARQGEPHGSVWLAEEQTAGRGRGNHKWHSAAGEGLYVSILLRPQAAFARLALLPLATGLAVAETIRSIAQLTVDLRWPNDLLIGSRKTGGILVESSGNFAVIGIGINVHQRQFPENLDTPATSLDLEAGTRTSRRALLIALLRTVEREAASLADPAAAAQIPARVAQASTWITGRRVEVHGPQACSGTTAGLDENGFLRVQTAASLVTVQTGGIRAAAPLSSTMV
jgi:BirA family transcriptional regulator, biotin operon repressor / biotin---[acetyl-CoA-carboxylase] ligase